MNSPAEDFYALETRLFQDKRDDIQQSGSKDILLYDFDKYKTSDTVFILATGHSVNSVNKAEWDYIRQHDSIGVNFFLLHNFSPTFNYYELDEPKLSILPDLLSHFTSKPSSHSHDLLINNEGCDFQRLKEIFSEHSVTPFITIYRRLQSTDKELLKIILERLLLSKDKEELLIHHSGSVIFLIFLSIYIGYKKIVVVGADGYKPGYFFENNELYKRNIDKKVIRWHNESNAHLKLLKTDPSISREHKSKFNMLPMNEFVQLMNDLSETFKKQWEVEFYWHSPGEDKTTLSDHFKKFDFGK